MAGSTRTNRSEVLRARVEPDLAEAVRQLQKGNDIANESDMVRLLIRRGITSVVGMETPKPKQPLNREQYAERSAALVEALGDLLHRVESHDADGAVLLADGLAKTTGAYARDLKKRVKR